MAENKTSAQSLQDRAAHEPTDLHRNFAKWLKDNTGVDVDLKTVQLACAMRMDFQRSEDNQADLAARKAAAANKAEAAKRIKREKLEAQLAKIQAELEDKPKADEPKVEAPVETPAPKATPSRRTAKKVTAQGVKEVEVISSGETKTPARRTRRPAAKK
jgi:hypothetical protein